MASELQNYLAGLRTVIGKKNGQQFARQVALPVHGNVTQQVKQFSDKIKNVDVFGFCESNLVDQNTAGVIAYRLAALISLVDNDFESGSFLHFTSFSLI